MSDTKTIAVIGATGAQGGGLVRAILADREGRFAARAVTRNPDSHKARAPWRPQVRKSWPVTPTTRGASSARLPAPRAPSWSPTSGSISQPSAS
jgi:uncharacterized protein YbjT (DUF2867 family)